MKPVLLTTFALVLAATLLMASRPDHAIDPADVQATLDRLRQIADAADRTERTTGQWPASRDHGPTPLGGRFAWHRTKNLAAVTIEHAPPANLPAWHAIDCRLDDGDLTGGWVWWREGRLVWVLAEE